MTCATETTIETLNVLLRGELSAAEEYRQAETEFHGQFVALELLRLYADHLHAANLLREQLTKHGARPFERGPARTQNMASTGSAIDLLQNLKEREQQAFDDYESALDNPELPRECHALIRKTLLPRCRDHLARLADLLNRQ